MQFKQLVRSFFGPHTWRKEWQDELSECLKDAQKALPVSMVVAIASESDFYAEVLFILSFLGLCLGSVLGFVSLQYWRLEPRDLILFPLGGFAVGASFFQFRHFYLARLAPRAVRDRVAKRAKSLFFDHSQNIKGQLALLYFSEMERELLFVSSPDLLSTVPNDVLQRILSQLIRDYKSAEPLVALKICLRDLGNLLRQHWGSANEDDPIIEVTQPLYIGATDRVISKPVPILKGSKDMN